MPSMEHLEHEATARPTTSLLKDALAAVRIRDEQPFEFAMLEMQGESLSEIIIRERRGEL